MGSIPFNMDDITAALSEGLPGTLSDITAPLLHLHERQPELAYLSEVET